MQRLARPAGRGREQAGRRRRSIANLDGQGGGARRQHAADDAARQHGGRSALLRQARLRPVQGLRSRWRISRRSRSPSASAPTCRRRRWPSTSALAKTGGTYANFASAALGSLPHFFGLLFAQHRRLSAHRHRPYKGTAKVLPALMSGEIPAGRRADRSTTSAPLVQSRQGAASSPTSGAKRSAAISRRADLQGERLRHRGLWPGTRCSRRPARRRTIVDAPAAAAIEAIRQPDVRAAPRAARPRA